jgi:hypothetical protein
VTLGQLALSWLAVFGWFAGWDHASRRIPGFGIDGSRSSGWLHGGQALLLTLLAALWFGSLGSGGWWLVFLLLGGLIEWRSPTGNGRLTGRDVVIRATGVGKIIVAGAILAWSLSA